MPSSEQEFFAVLQCIDDYLGAQQTLGAALKDGLFNIARGKYTLGSELGQQRYPGDMQAAALIQVTSPADEEAIYDEFKLQRLSREHLEDNAGTVSSTAAENEQGSTPSSKASADNQQQQHLHSTNPINWFSALPPPPVRQAQADFTKVLQQVVEAANSLQRLRQRVAELSLQDQEDAGSDAGSDAS